MQILFLFQSLGKVYVFFVPKYQTCQVQWHKILETNQQKWAAYTHMAGAMSCEGKA